MPPHDVSDRRPESPVRGVNQWLRALAGGLSIRRVSALYILLLLVVVYSLWLPDRFLTDTTLKSILLDPAVTAMVAIGLLIPLAAGLFDLSVGLTLALVGILSAWLMGVQDLPIAAAVCAALACGVGIGVVNGTLVAALGMSSVIATLGVASITQAMVLWVSDGQHVVGLPSEFESLATTEVLGLALPLYYLLGTAMIVWYVLEWTPAGRYVYATGDSTPAARLSGVPTRRVAFAVLVASAAIASIAGLVATARVGAGSPDTGVSYLFPAFAAAFLGATQVKPGRFNVWGTLLAVYLLATVVKGLELAGGPIWLPDLFNGVALLVAVAISGGHRRA